MNNDELQDAGLTGDAQKTKPAKEAKAPGKVGPQHGEHDSASPPLKQWEGSDTEPTLSHRDETNMDLIMNIPVTVSLEVGRTQISIRELLLLNQGSIIELTRLAGEPMDVLVNGTLVAHGEVVVVNDKFGIRLTEVVSASERVKKLQA